MLFEFRNPYGKIDHALPHSVFLPYIHLSIYSVYYALNEINSNFFKECNNIWNIQKREMPIHDEQSWKVYRFICLYVYIGVWVGQNQSDTIIFALA